MIAGDAVPGPLGRLAVDAVGLVGDTPEVVEDLSAGGDGVGGDGSLAVDGVEDGDLGGLGGVPAGVRGGVGPDGRGEEDMGGGGEARGDGRGGGVGADGGSGGRGVVGAAAAGEGREAAAGGAGGRRETKGFVTDSWDEKGWPLCRTYTVFPSSEWTEPRSQPWRSR